MSQRASLLEAYEGGNAYTLRFEKGQLPPVKGFWSLTMYDEQMFFVANPINRYSMSLRTNPKFESDGALVILIQNEPRVRQGSQLAAGAQGQIPADAAPLLAGRE